MFRALHREVKIALHSLWYLHTYWRGDTRGCVIQFWPPDDEHMCSKHAEAWNKLIVRQICCASSWLITEINILRCTDSKTSKSIQSCSFRAWKHRNVQFVHTWFHRHKMATHYKNAAFSRSSSWLNSNSVISLCICVAYQWRTEGGGSNPLRNSEGPPKSCQKQPDCENC